MWRCWPDIVKPPAKKAKRKVKEHADSEADTPKTRGHDQETEDNAAAAVVPAPAPAQSQPPKPANVSRHFLERWRVARPWLVHSAQEKKMFCHVCSAHAKGKRRGNAFVVGCTTMKLETIVFHENSQSHKDCLIAEEKVSEPLQQAPCVISLVKLPEGTKEKMAILFRTSHAIAKNARPFSDFKWMCK